MRVFQFEFNSGLYFKFILTITLTWPYLWQVIHTQSSVIYQYPPLPPYTFSTHLPLFRSRGEPLCHLVWILECDREEEWHASPSSSRWSYAHASCLHTSDDLGRFAQYFCGSSVYSHSHDSASGELSGNWRLYYRKTQMKNKIHQPPSITDWLESHLHVLILNLIQLALWSYWQVMNISKCLT